MSEAISRALGWGPFAERGEAEARIGLAALDRRGPGAVEIRDEAKARYRHAAHRGDARIHLDAIEREPPPAESEAATTGPAASLPASAEPPGPAQTTLGGGRFGVPLGAFRRRGRADKAWERLRAAPLSGIPYVCARGGGQDENRGSTNIAASHAGFHERPATVGLVGQRYCRRPWNCCTMH